MQTRNLISVFSNIRTEHINRDCVQNKIFWKRQRNVRFIKKRISWSADRPVKFSKQQIPPSVCQITLVDYSLIKIHAHGNLELQAVAYILTGGFKN